MGGYRASRLIVLPSYLTMHQQILTNRVRDAKNTVTSAASR
jgi:hypothetical protein